MAFSASLPSLGRPFTTKMPIIEATRPMATTASGKMSPFTATPPPVMMVTPSTGLILVTPRPMAWNADTPRMIDATSVTAKDSKRSAAIPAQSPTLSPTLSAMVAGLRGSSSGIPASTLPTRSAPTSAALVKMPPPTRRKRARSEPPKPKPMRIEVEVFWNSITMTTAPRRPRPAVSRPATPPVRKATLSAALKSLRLAAAAVRTLPRTASHMPKKPMAAEKRQPMMNAAVRKMPDCRNVITSAPPMMLFPSFSRMGILLMAVEVRNTTTASGITIMPIVRN
ncbi:unannotated protein [freshwater metagenome]|uniref:Unannotated protein n=1 Tax=freshwater metagenome TaxID=449393 RepID=A0A6J7VJ82_9ZZZZ